MLFDDLMGPYIDPEEEARRRAAMQPRTPQEMLTGPMNRAGADAVAVDKLFPEQFRRPQIVPMGDKPDYGYNPDTGLPNSPPPYYQPPLNSMMPQPPASGGGWRPTAARLPESQLGRATSMPFWANSPAQVPNSTVGTGVPPMSMPSAALPPGEFVGPPHLETGPQFDAGLQELYGSPVRIDTALRPGDNPPPEWAGWNSVRHAPLMPFTDSFMANEPIHTLGVNGFRTGMSSPMVDYSGMMQRAQVQSLAKEMTNLFSHNEMELDRAKILTGRGSGDSEMKREQLFNKTLAMTSNPAIGTPQALAQIKKMRDNKEIPDSEANQAIMSRVFTRRSADGRTLVPIFHPERDSDMSGLFSAINSEELKGMSPADIKKYLQNSMGITDEMARKRYQTLLEQGIPFWSRFSNWDAEPDPRHFNKKKLTPEQQTEFEGLTTIFGRK